MKKLIIKILSLLPTTWLHMALVRRKDVAMVSIIDVNELNDMATFMGMVRNPSASATLMDIK